MRIRQFCKPAKRGSKAWENCQNVPCCCEKLYKDSEEAVKQSAFDLLEALKDMDSVFSDLVECEPDQWSDRAHAAINKTKRALKKARG